MPKNFTDKSLQNIMKQGGLNAINVATLGELNLIMQAAGATIPYGAQGDLGKVGAFTDAEIKNYTYAANGTLYGGLYQLVNVDSAATAASVATGTLAYLKHSGRSTYSVTDVAHADATGMVAGVFLNAIAPGNYGAIFVGSGLVNVAFKTGLTNGTPAIGDNVVGGVAGGFVDDAAAGTVAPTGLFIGRAALTVPASATTSPIWIPSPIGRI